MAPIACRAMLCRRRAPHTPRARTCWHAKPDYEIILMCLEGCRRSHFRYPPPACGPGSALLQCLRLRGPLEPHQSRALSCQAPDVRPLLASCVACALPQPLSHTRIHIAWSSPEQRHARCMVVARASLYWKLQYMFELRVREGRLCKELCSTAAPSWHPPMEAHVDAA